MHSDNYQLLISKLDEFIRKYYKNQLVRGGIYGVAAFLLFYLSVTLLEYYAHFGMLVRAALFYGFILVNGYIIIKLIVFPLLKLNRLGTIISYEQAADIIGSHFSEIQDKLTNVLQLQADSRLKTQDSGLIEASIAQKIRVLKPVPFVSAIDISQNKKYLKYAAVPLLLFLFILFSAPGILTDSTKRIIKHDTYFEKEAPFRFAILNKDLKAVQHGDFQLDVKLTGDEIPENVYVLIDNNQFKLEKDGTVDFNYLFKNVQRSFRFQLSADGFKSRPYELTALPNPVLLNFEISLDYPGYTGKRDEVVENSGDLIVPAGTRAVWKFHTKDTEWIRMNFNDSSFSIHPTAENNYSYSARLLKNKKYSVSAANSFLKNKDSVSYAINVVPDAFPAISVEEKKDSLSGRRLYFFGSIKDDYGFTSLHFNYKYLKSADSAGAAGPAEVPLPFNRSAIQDQFYHFWDLSQLPLSAGDEIEYYFEVFDNDGVNGAKSSRTKSLIYKAPTLDEIAKNTEEKNTKIKSDIEQSIKQARAMQRELDELNKKVLEKKTLSWEEKKRMKELIEKQNELEKSIESIKNENEKNNFEQSEFKQQDEVIAGKQKQLEELFKNVLTEEMKEKFKELEMLMDQMDKESMKEAIGKMKLSNKDIEKELDRNLEIFKQLEVEQKLQQSIDKLNDMAGKQEKESEKSQDKNSDSRQLGENQEQLNREFEQVQKDMEDMEKKNQELEHPNNMGNTEEQRKGIQEQMENSSQQLHSGNKKKASQSQKNAAQQMENLARQLADMKKSMEAENNSEDIEALRDILENLLHLSFDQEGLMSELSKMKTDNPNYPKLAQKQKKLQDDAKMIEDSLFALSKRNPQVGAVVNREISAINMNMEKAIQSLAERQSYEAAGRQQFSMTSINNLALMLNESLSGMQADQRKKQGNMAGAGSCNKPGGMGKKPGQANMSQMQEQINRQIQQLKNAMEKGDRQGKKGQEGGGQGMSEQLAKLAARQEALRREVQKAAEKYKDGKNGAGFSKMLEQMEQNESDLVNKMITQETIRRQQEILTRLLESEKAEREREMDEQRQSDEAKNENYRNFSQFIEYNRLKQKETELLKTIPPSLKPFYKNKVNEYFNNFNQ